MHLTPHLERQPFGCVEGTQRFQLPAQHSHRLLHKHVVQVHHVLVLDGQVTGAVRLQYM